MSAESNVDFTVIIDEEKWSSQSLSVAISLKPFWLEDGSVASVTRVTKKKVVAHWSG